jgi:hypothetical protein
LRLSLQLNPTEKEELVKVLKEEIYDVSNDSWYAEDSSYSLEELKSVLNKVLGGGNIFTPVDFGVINGLSYVKLLGLGDTVEDDDPKVLALESVQARTWDQRKHWAGGYIDPQTKDKEEFKILMECETFCADLKDRLREDFK